MTLDEATKFVQQAWPGEGVHLRRDRQICEVVARDGKVLGRAFNWRSALREAYKPKLDENQKARVAAHEAAIKDRELFVDFLWEYLKPKFEEWKASRKRAKEYAAQVKADPSMAYAHKEAHEAMMREAGEDGSGNPSPDAGRDQVHSEQLVQVDAANERPEPARPTGLVLLGRE